MGNQHHNLKNLIIPVKITTRNGANKDSFTIDQQDETNNKKGTVITVAGTGEGIDIIKLGSGNGGKISGSISSASDLVGLLIDVVNSGAGQAYGLIIKNGRLAINTEDPGAHLHVVDVSTGLLAQFERDSVGEASLQLSATSGRIQVGSTDDLDFQTDTVLGSLGTTRMRIKKGGYSVGIGPIDPNPSLNTGLHLSSDITNSNVGVAVENDTRKWKIYVKGITDAFWIEDASVGLLRFFIGTDGKIAMGGNINPVALMDVTNNSDELQLRVYRAGTTVTDDIAVFVSDVGGTKTTVCKVKGDGDLENANNSYGGISGRELKENIVPAKSKLNDFMKLQFRSFNFKNNPRLKQLGLIADEVEPIFPGLVKNTPNYKEVFDMKWKPSMSKKGKRGRPKILEATGTFTQSIKYSVISLIAAKALQEHIETTHKKRFLSNSGEIVIILLLLVIIFLMIDIDISSYIEQEWIKKIFSGMEKLPHYFKNLLLPINNSLIK